MQQTASIRPRRLIFLVCLLLALLGITGFWLKSPYYPTQARERAEEFVTLLQQGNFQLAHEMTFKNTLVGKTPLELEKISARQLCSVKQKLAFVSHSPPQSHGNRMRRWLSGREIEMPEISMEFENTPCLFSVTLRRTADKQWKVFNFQSHAG